MRLLVDQNLAPSVAAALRSAGHDAVHVADRRLSRAEDAEILKLAARERRVVVSEDTDFSTLLARTGAATPSFVLIRSGEPLTPNRQVEMLLANLPRVEQALDSGAVVVIARGRVRVRPLPIKPPPS